MHLFHSQSLRCTHYQSITCLVAALIQASLANDSMALNVMDSLRHPFLNLSNQGSSLVIISENYDYFVHIKCHKIISSESIETTAGYQWLRLGLRPEEG